MRVVSVFPLDEFRLALKKVYGAAAPKGPFTALSQATLFFSRNSCTIACCNLNQWCQATIPAQGDEFSLTLYDTQRLLEACAYFSGELHLEYETAEKSRTTVTSPTTRRVFPVEGVRSISWYSTAISIRCRKSFSRSRSIRSTLELFSASSHRSGTLFPRTQTAPGAAAYNLRITGCTRWTDIG